MTEQELQDLWQDQPVELVSHDPTERSAPEGIDFAVPTSKFRAGPRSLLRTITLVASPFALAAAALLFVHLGATPAVSPSTLPPVATPVEDRLARCRALVDDQTEKPDWHAARAVCNEVLEQDPIDTTALGLRNRIDELETCQENYEFGVKHAKRGRPYEAYGRLSRVPVTCGAWHLRALIAMGPVEAEVRRQSAATCETAAQDQKWELALGYCENYARLACRQGQPTLNDPSYLRFLEVRRHAMPGAPAWLCPVEPPLDALPLRMSAKVQARAQFTHRYTEPELGEALMFQFDGRWADAEDFVERVLENPSRAASHQTARELLRDFKGIEELYNQGTTLVGRHDVEGAASAFRQLLDVDERLMLGPESELLTENERRDRLRLLESFARKNAILTMAGAAYDDGKVLADQKDFRGACRLWKIGSSFSRSSVDLLKALTNVCTKKAQDQYERAQTCDDLSRVLDFAVDGDGVAERVASVRSLKGCPR